MKVADFDTAIASIPRYVAVFKVTNPPAWMPEEYKLALAKNGNEATWVTSGWTFRVAGAGNIALKPSHVSFYTYRKVSP